MAADGIANAIVNFIIFGIVLAIRKAISGKGLNSFLIHFDKRGTKLFLEGLFLGIVLAAMYPVLVIIFGYGEVTFNAAKLGRTIVIAIPAAIGFLAVALLEEAVFRGYIFLKLEKKYSLTIALIISSVIFGGLHFGTYSGSKGFWIGLINAGIIGVLLCLVVYKSNSLMLAIGYHLTWNLTQEIIMNKGETAIGLMVKGSMGSGSGGMFETEILTTGILFIMAMYIFVRFRRTGKTRRMNLNNEVNTNTGYIDK